MATGDRYKVTCMTLAIRNNPSVLGMQVGVLQKDDIITELEEKQELGTKWIRHDKGWSQNMPLQLQSIGQGPVNTEPSTNNSPPPSSPSVEEATEEISDEDSGYLPDMEDFFNVNDDNISESEFANIKHIMGVFGLPYQFLPNTDLRLYEAKNVQNIGFEYADKIVERIPLLFLAPGKASFMTKYSKKSRKNILEKILTLDSGIGNAQSLDDLISSDGRYYTFEYRHTDYYKIVNPMCRIAARFMGVQDVRINGTPLDRMNWEDFTKSGIKSIGSFGTFTSVPFYVDAANLSSINESFGNTTGQSMIAQVNQISDLGREITFLTGTIGSATGLDALQNDADMATNIENVQNTINKIMGKGNFLSNLASHIGTIAMGGKMVFPQIWQESQFSRSYSCDLKFISPDPSPLSVYLNVIVPLCHVLALVAPQTVKQNPNGYVNPFLVRAMYKGFFQVDTGIITDMNVSKGAECQWTPEGVPTSINVSLTIKDLYEIMSITSTENTDWKFDTLNNTALMDYIANLCGINIFKPEIARIIDMWYVNNFSNRISDFFEVSIWEKMQQKVQNSIMNIFR